MFLNFDCSAACIVMSKKDVVKDFFQLDEVIYKENGLEKVQ